MQRESSSGNWHLRMQFHCLMLTLCMFFVTGCRCPWSCTNSQLSESHRCLQNGIVAFHDGDHSKAESLLAQAIESRPGDPILREHLASNYLKQGKTVEAVDQLMQASQMSGNDNEAILVRIGQIYLENGQWILAEQFAKQALSTNRQLADAWVLQADVEYAKGNLSDALLDFQRALSLNPDNPNVQMKVAEIHRLSGRNLRAYSTIEQMLSQLPPDQQPEQALLLASRILVDMQQPAQAIEKLRIVTSRSNACAECYLVMASAQKVLGRTLDAQATLVAAAEKFPKNSTISNELQNLDRSDERIASLDLNQGKLIR